MADSTKCKNTGKTRRHRFGPRSLTGRIVLLVIVAVVATQLSGLAFLADERAVAVRSAARDQILERTAAMVRLLDDSPVELREKILASVSSRRLRFWTSDEKPESAANQADSQKTAINVTLTERLSALLGDTRRIQIQSGETDYRNLRQRMRDWHLPWKDRGDDLDGKDDANDNDKEKPRRRWREPLLDLSLSVELKDGQWLGAQSTFRMPSPPWGRALFWSIIIVGVLSLFAAHMVKRVTRPLRNLTEAAEKAGRGEDISTVPVEGPDDVQATIKAFNQMHERLDRFVKDRMQMLAALSHDLRTPITVLRLRVELLDDEETKAKLIATLDDMQRMAEETLAFAREEGAREDTRVIDLASLIDSLCDDLTELGHNIALEEMPRTDYACRPTAMRRAIGNLIENACAYGKLARLSMTTDDDALQIVIEDDGPGIPEHLHEDVFKPFVRLDTSRSRDGGGIGLGLAIARSIIRAHGGDISLQPGKTQGLVVTISLPRTKAS